MLFFFLDTDTKYDLVSHNKILPQYSHSGEDLVIFNIWAAICCEIRVFFTSIYWSEGSDTINLQFGLLCSHPENLRGREGGDVHEGFAQQMCCVQHRVSGAGEKSCMPSPTPPSSAGTGTLSTEDTSRGSMCVAAGLGPGHRMVYPTKIDKKAMRRNEGSRELKHHPTYLDPSLLWPHY